MSFLAPLFFTALAALAVPVFIHLMQREKKQVVFFPSLMFLDKIPYKSVQRRRIHNWLLLLLRAAAIVLIIIAFARPFLTDTTIASVAASGAREVVILLDHSYSMGYGDRWARAQEAARQVVDGLQAGDRASLVLFGQSADVQVRSSDERARLRVAIDAASVSPNATRYAPVLKVAQGILQQSARPERELVVISDFQRYGWEGAEDVRFPRGTAVTPMAITDEGTSDVAVSSVSLQREFASGQERVTLTAGLQNRGGAPVSDLPVRLEIDGLEVQAAQATLEPQASGSVTFPPLVLPSTTAQGVVRIGEDALAWDDAFFFTIQRGRSIPVLVVDRPTAAQAASLHLRVALGIGREPAMSVTRVSVDQVSAGLLADQTVVILNDVPLTGELPDRLQAFVERGGGLFVILGDRTTWPESFEAVPGLPAGMVDRGSEISTVGAIDFSHPVFELFRAPRSGSFQGVRVFRYRGLDMPADRGRVVARFDDGGIALAERELGEGRTLVWTTTLDNVWNDLVLKPVFLPFVRRAVTYLAQYEEPRAWQTIGEVYAQRSDGARYIALSPSGARVPLGERGGGAIAIPVEPEAGTGGAGDAAEAQNLLPLTEQGFYEIRDGDGRVSTSIAVNVDVAESDLTPLDPQELVAAVTGRASVDAGAEEEAVTLRPVDLERRQALWWYLLIGGLALLAAESLLSNRLSRAAS